MARYIDAVRFISELEQEKTVSLEFEDGVAVYEIEHMMNLIGMQPTADVVPKSEVERLEREKAEMLVSKETDVLISMEKLVKVRTEHPIFKAIEEKVAREIFVDVDGITDLFAKGLIGELEMYDKLAELKKKYTGDRE